MSDKLCEREIEEDHHAQPSTHEAVVEPSHEATLEHPVTETELSPTQVSQQFHSATRSKLQKALTEYKLLFARWKRQPLSATDEFSIPEWKIQDGNDILRWEFNFPTVEQTVWHPLFLIMQEELEDAQQEINAGDIAFANITLETTDEILERSLAHNRRLREVLMNVENPRPISPPKAFVAAEIDLSEFDHIDGGRDTTRRERGGGLGRGGGPRRERDARRDSSRGSRAPSRGRRETSQRGDDRREDDRRDDRRRQNGGRQGGPRRRRDDEERPYY